MEQDLENYASRKISFSRNSWILLIGIIFIASTLRSPLTSVGPIIAQIKDSVGISNFLASFLTTIPLLAFALISPLAPKFSRRFGMEVTLFSSLCLLLMGILIRSMGAVSTLLIGTFLIGVAIAFGNVLLPGLLKNNFPLHIGLMTGIYSISLNISATLASGIAVPIATETRLGWQGALGVWSVFGLLAIIMWLPQLKNRKTSTHNSHTGKETFKKGSMLRSPMAWCVSLAMGLQSLIFYTTSTWIPEVLKSEGLQAGSAGWMLALLQFAQLPMMFIIPVIADKMKNQRVLVFSVFIIYFTGYAGILFGGGHFTALWMIIIGIAGGSSFGLAMMFFTLRSETPQQAAELSGMAQSIGYLLAAGGPVLFATLHDVTNGWTAPMIMLLVVIFVWFLSAMKAGKDEYIFTPKH